MGNEKSWWGGGGGGGGIILVDKLLDKVINISGLICSSQCGLDDFSDGHIVRGEIICTQSRKLQSSC